MDKPTVVSETAKWTIWWLAERKTKLREQLSGSMAINPFLLPIIYDLHNASSFSDLNDLIVGGHLMTGHSTGFGKLIDEKILPNVFKTTKLDKDFRKNSPFGMPCFDEIDHIVKSPNGQKALLSLKASRWTIQLTMAVQLNHAFHEILDKFPGKFSEIAVGVFYGKKEDLTDKYDIARGINRGAKHKVVDLTSKVHVYAGREFWAWINSGQASTQEWVLEGIKQGLAADNSREECGALLDAFKKKIKATYDQYINADGEISWDSILKDING
ncbi:MAG: restriction endonuclease [Alphaproteobacteria bacterium]|nr:restriction endonuclease [Alphaproteobacteria bacterium]